MTTGHETVMAKATFFGLPHSSAENNLFTEEFVYQDSLLEIESVSSGVASANQATSQYALLEFEKPIVCPPLSKVIGSKLDNDVFSNKCRIAFHGNLEECITRKDYESSILPRIRIFKLKRREGLVDRVCEIVW